jgi:hypothetical protein
VSEPTLESASFYIAKQTLVARPRVESGEEGKGKGYFEPAAGKKDERHSTAAQQQIYIM